MLPRYCLALLTAAALFGQGTASIRVDANLTLIPVTVLDPSGRMVTGLDADHFQIFEDGVPQTITLFGSEDSPLSIGIVLDISGSMSRAMANSKKAVAEFFKSANPEDEAFLVEFRDRPELVLPFTHDLGTIEDRILFARSKGFTALLDGLTLAIAEMKKAAHPRKALLLISDGGDNSSRYTGAEVRKRLKESDVQIYATAVNTPASWSPEQSLLTDLAELSGGGHFGLMPQEMEKLGIELRTTYLLGYSPRNAARDGKYRSVVVKVSVPRMPKLKVSWRRGYFAPTQ